MRSLLMITTLFLVAGLMAVPTALAQEEDEVTEKGGTALTPSNIRMPSPEKVKDLETVGDGAEEVTEQTVSEQIRAKTHQLREERGKTHGWRGVRSAPPFTA